MADLDTEISAYEEMRQDLEAHHMGKWVLVCNSSLVGTYDSFEAAANEAVSKFGRGPYLIRQIGAQGITLPASVAFFQYGSNKMRIQR